MQWHIPSLSLSLYHALQRACSNHISPFWFPHLCNRTLCSRGRPQGINAIGHRPLTAGKEQSVTHVGVPVYSPCPQKRTLLWPVTWTRLAESPPGPRYTHFAQPRIKILTLLASWRTDQDPCYLPVNQYGFSIKINWTWPYQWDLGSTSPPALFPLNIFTIRSMWWILPLGRATLKSYSLWAQVIYITQIEITPNHLLLYRTFCPLCPSFCSWLLQMLRDNGLHIRVYFRNRSHLLEYVVHSTQRTDSCSEELRFVGHWLYWGWVMEWSLSCAVMKDSRQTDTRSISFRADQKLKTYRVDC
jgi:hypothetical protein